MADETPAMVPSAEERAHATFDTIASVHIQHGFGALIEAYRMAIEAAHRDGYLAGRAAERAALRKALTEPNEDLVEAAAKAHCDHHVGPANSVWGSLMNQGHRKDEMRAALRAVADALLPTTPPA